MLEDVGFDTINGLFYPRTDRKGMYIWKFNVPEEELEGKYFDSNNAEIYLPEGYIQHNYLTGEPDKKAIGRKLLRKTTRRASLPAFRRGVKDIEYPEGTVVTEDLFNNLTTANEDYDKVLGIDTYPADIPEEEVEKTVRKALKHKQMDEAIRKAFEKQKNILNGIDGNLEDDDDD